MLFIEFGRSYIMYTMKLAIFKKNNKKIERSKNNIYLEIKKIMLVTVVSQVVYIFIN